MLEASRALNGRFTAFGTPFVALHPQLVLPLPRNGQVREFVFNPLSHPIYSSCERLAPAFNLTIQGPKLLKPRIFILAAHFSCALLPA
jgi:hypothetical protein